MLLHVYAFDNAGGYECYSTRDLWEIIAERKETCLYDVFPLIV